MCESAQKRSFLKKNPTWLVLSVLGAGLLYLKEKFNNYIKYGEVSLTSLRRAFWVPSSIAFWFLCWQACLRWLRSWDRLLYLQGILLAWCGCSSQSSRMASPWFFFQFSFSSFSLLPSMGIYQCQRPKRERTSYPIKGLLWWGDPYFLSIIVLFDNDSFLSGMSSSKKNDNSSRFHTKDMWLHFNVYGELLSMRTRTDWASGQVSEW